VKNKLERRPGSYPSRSPRASFILSKLAANGLGILIFIILIPGLIGIVEISTAAGRLVDIPGLSPGHRAWHI